MHEPSDLAGALQRLRCSAGFVSATNLLREACASGEPSRSLELVLQALEFVERLPRPLQRMAWLSTFGSPRPLRADHLRAIQEVWGRGISRSVDGLAGASGVARLLCAVATAPDDRRSALLARLDSCQAFTELVTSRQPQSIVAGAVQLMLCGKQAAADRIAMAAVKAQVEPIAEIAVFARWLHSLSTPDDEDVLPPDSSAVRFALTAPALRGLRRRGARAHGRRAGRLAAANVAKGALANPQLAAIPKCLTPSAEIVDVMMPLLIDYISSGIAELAPGRNTRDGAHLYASSCPALCDAVASIAGHWHDRDYESRTDWLEEMLGLTQILPQEPSDGMFDPVGVTNIGTHT